MTEIQYKKYIIEIWTEDLNDNTQTLHTGVYCYVKLSEVINETLLYLADKSSDKSRPYMDKWIRTKYQKETARIICKDTELYTSELKEAMKQLSLLLKSNALTYGESFVRLGNVDLHVSIIEKEKENGYKK
jgi:hypothetical protein